MTERNINRSNFVNKNQTQNLFKVQLKLFKIVHHIIHLVPWVLDSAWRNKNTNLSFQENVEFVAQLSPLHDALAILEVLVAEGIYNVRVI